MIWYLISLLAWYVFLILILRKYTNLDIRKNITSMLKIVGIFIPILVMFCLGNKYIINTFYHASKSEIAHLTTIAFQYEYMKNNNFGELNAAESQFIDSTIVRLKNQQTFTLGEYKDVKYEFTKFIISHPQLYLDALKKDNNNE